MTKEEKKLFWQQEVPGQVRQNIYLGFGVAGFSTVMTIIYALLINPMMWLDALLNGGLTLGIGLGKSRACAVVMLGYFIISKLVMLEQMTTGSLLVAVCLTILYACGVQGTFAYQRLLAERVKAEEPLDDWSADDDEMYYDEEE